MNYAKKLRQTIRKNANMNARKAAEEFWKYVEGLPIGRRLWLCWMIVVRKGERCQKSER